MLLWLVWTKLAPCLMEPVDIFFVVSLSAVMPLLKHLVTQERMDILVLLLLNPQLSKSSLYFGMLMIFTRTLQPPTNGLYIVKPLYVSTVVEIMYSIIAMSPITKSQLHRSRISYKRKGILFRR